MATIIILVGLVLFVTGIIKVGAAFFKKKPKKPALAILGGSVLLTLAGGALLEPSNALEIDNTLYTTNAKGYVTIEGTTDPEAELTADNDSVAHDGHFTYEFLHNGEGDKKLTFVSEKDGNIIEKTVTIKASKQYLAHLAEEADKASLAEAESALALAEKEPSQENYDLAFTQIKALNQERPQLTKRLEIVEKHLPIYAAVLKAEQSKTREDHKQAVASVKLATLNQSAFNQRLTVLDDTIKGEEEKARIQQLKNDAEAKVAQAESSKSETDYQAAMASLSALPEKDQQLESRVAHVHQHIESEKQAAAQAAAQAAQAQAQQPAIQPVVGQAASGQTVYITPTGSKYHSRKCGPGTYNPTTLESAQQNYEPCKRCYGG